MYELNDKIKNLIPYEPISGEYNIRLDANECTLNYDAELMKEVHKAIDSVNFNRYPDPTCKVLREAFAEYYGINSENVTVGNGSDELIFLVESAFLKKGETVLTASPDFSMYEFYSSITENPGVKYIKNTELNIDVEVLIDDIRKNDVKLLIFSNPCNPTGQGIGVADVKKLLGSVNSLVVLDEAYMDFWNEEESLIREVEKYDNLIVFRTASKALGSAALRLGFAVADKKISNALAAVKSPYNVNTLSQKIGALLYKKKDFLKNRTETIVTNTKTLYNELVRLGKQTNDLIVYPTKTNFVFVKCSFGKELFDYLNTKSIVIRYMGDYLRITSGTPEEIKAVTDAIEDFITQR